MTGNLRFMTVYLLLITAALFVHLHSDTFVPMNKPLSGFPVRYKSWHMLSQSYFSDAVLNSLKPTDYLDRQYADDKGRRVELYIGYHGGGKEGGELHSPKHCLPGSGWYLNKEKKTTLDLGGDNINLVEAVYQSDERREVFFYWFQVKGRTLTDEYSLKMAEILNSVFHGRRDAAFIRVSSPLGADDEKAFSTVIEFIRDFYPVIDDFLPQ